MDEEKLGRDVLELPFPKMEELKDQSMEGDYGEQIITYYLQVCPYASWEDIGGVLQYWGEDAAFHEVKKFLQPDEGA